MRPTSLAALAAALLASSTACGKSRPGKVRVELPAGGKYREALLRTRWFHLSAFELSPAGGPTDGYEVVLQLWPRGPELLLAGRLAKGPMPGDPRYAALEKAQPKLVAEPDGHALAWSPDGATWHAVYLDGRVPFFCPHRAVTPGAIPKTSAIALEILSGPPHGLLPRVDSLGSASHDPGLELKGALAFALGPGSSPALREAALAWLTAPEHQQAQTEGEVRRVLDADAARSLREHFRASNGSASALEPLRTDDRVRPEFWKALAEEPRPEPPAPASRPEPAAPPCQAVKPELGPLPAELTVEAAVARLAFPERADGATCAQLAKLDQKIAARAARELATPRPATTPAEQRRMVMGAGCGSAIQQVVMLSMTAQRVAGSAGKAAIEAYEQDLESCGHADQRDLGCERAALGRRQAQWRVALEDERRKLCRLQNEALNHALECQKVLDTLGDAPSISWDLRTGLWNGLRAISSTSSGAFCPPRPATWPQPLERR